MSDDFSAFYNAWETVFGAVRYHLLCDWHVKRAWANHPFIIWTSSNLEREIVQYLFDLIINKVDIATLPRHLEMKESLIDEEIQSIWSYFEN